MTKRKLSKVDKQIKQSNQRAKKEGRLAKPIKLGTTQIIFFRKKPKFPKPDKSTE